VNKIAMNILEKAGWTVDIINIATPQRADTQTNYDGNGQYLNFYNSTDVVQVLGSKPAAESGARIDSNAKVNKEVTPSNNWFSNSGGHSFHQDPEAQKQILQVIQKFF
jgi:hypothetical protein